MQSTDWLLPNLSDLSGSEMREGDWKCEKCNNINYSFRTKCNKQNCGADKPSESNKNSPSEPAVDENDQVCCCVLRLLCILFLAINRRSTNLKGIEVNYLFVSNSLLRTPLFYCLSYAFVDHEAAACFSLLCGVSNFCIY